MSIQEWFLARSTLVSSLRTQHLPNQWVWMETWWTPAPEGTCSDTASSFLLSTWALSWPEPMTKYRSMVKYNWQETVHALMWNTKAPSRLSCLSDHIACFDLSGTAGPQQYRKRGVVWIITASWGVTSCLYSEKAYLHHSLTSRLEGKSHLPVPFLSYRARQKAQISAG